MGYGDTQSAIRNGHQHHQHLLREAEDARLLAPYSWRARAAGALYAWAERLEPTAPTPTARPAHLAHSKGA